MDEAEMQRHSKRSKIAIACESCRSRKVKCDGKRPVCGPCRARGSNALCIYHSSTSSWDNNREQYIKNLLHRISHLEERLQQAGTEKLNGQSHDHGAPLMGHQRRHDSVDALGSMPHASVAQGFMGSSSAASFADEVHRAHDPAESALWTAKTIHDFDALPTSLSLVDAKQYLPPRKIGDYLLSIYWQTAHVLYPIVDKTSFQQAYDLVYEGQNPGQDPVMFYSLLNMIFALAAQSSPTSNEHGISRMDVEAFFHRGRQLLYFDIFGGWSLQLVQILLVSAQFLQSTEEPHQCWVAVGIAIRAAESLGMHLNSTSANMTEDKEQQLLRRLWWCCLSMDRLLALTLGRPPCIPKGIVDLVIQPEPVDADGADYSCFVQSCRLILILDNILHTLYNATREDQIRQKNCYSPMDAPIDKILYLDHELCEFEKRIPGPLKAPPLGASPEETKFAMQANVLRQRTLIARIMTYRPALAACTTHEKWRCEKPDNSTLQVSVTRKCATHCVRAAQEMIAVVHKWRRVDIDVGVLSPWWYNVFYVHSSATVILAARLNPSIEAELGLESLKQSSIQVFEILKDYAPVSEVAQKSLSNLRVLRDGLNLSSLAGDTEMTNLPQPLLQMKVNDLPKGISNGIGSGGNVGSSNGNVPHAEHNATYDMSWLDSIPFDFYLGYDGHQTDPYATDSLEQWMAN